MNGGSKDRKRRRANLAKWRAAQHIVIAFEGKIYHIDWALLMDMCRRAGEWISKAANAFMQSLSRLHNWQFSKIPKPTA